MNLNLAFDISAITGTAAGAVKLQKAQETGLSLDFSAVLEGESGLPSGASLQLPEQLPATTGNLLPQDGGKALPVVTGGLPAPAIEPAEPALVQFTVADEARPVPAGRADPIAQAAVPAPVLRAEQAVPTNPQNLANPGDLPQAKAAPAREPAQMMPYAMERPARPIPVKPVQLPEEAAMPQTAATVPASNSPQQASDSVPRSLAGPIPTKLREAGQMEPAQAGLRVEVTSPQAPQAPVRSAPTVVTSKQPVSDQPQSHQQPAGSEAEQAVLQPQPHRKQMALDQRLQTQVQQQASQSPATVPLPQTEHRASAAQTAPMQHLPQAASTNRQSGEVPVSPRMAAPKPMVDAASAKAAEALPSNSANTAANHQPGASVRNPQAQIEAAIAGKAPTVAEQPSAAGVSPRPEQAQPAPATRTIQPAQPVQSAQQAHSTQQAQSAQQAQSTQQSETKQQVQPAQPAAQIQQAPTQTAQPLAAADIARPAPMSAPAETTQTAASQPARHDFEAVVDRLAAAREMARPGRAEMQLNHREFGNVSVQFEMAGQALRVALGSGDAAFAPAVQAALAERPIVAITETARSEGQTARQDGQNASQQGSAHQSAQGDAQRQDSNSRANQARSSGDQLQRQAGKGDGAPSHPDRTPRDDGRYA